MRSEIFVIITKDKSFVVNFFLEGTLNEFDKNVIALHDQKTVFSS